VLSDQVEALAREIAGGDTNPEIQHSARLIAEAQIDLLRIRQARHQLLTDALHDLNYDSRTSVRAKVRFAKVRFAKVRLLAGLLWTDAPERSMAALRNVFRSTPQGDDKLTLILSQDAKRLQALDRYERRALSRRNLVVQVLDCTVACRCIEDNF
jgi:hypothetical protein